MTSYIREFLEEIASAEYDPSHYRHEQLAARAKRLLEEREWIPVEDCDWPDQTVHWIQYLEDVPELGLARDWMGPLVDDLSRVREMAESNQGEPFMVCKISTPPPLPNKPEEEGE